MTRQNCDVVVVGGGAMGSSAAWWLARRGRHVVLLERFEQGHVRGSSHGGSRIFRFAYPDPDYVRLAQAALPLWRELEADAGRSLLDTTGGLDHGPRASVQPVADALMACGATAIWLSPKEAEERWPGMRFEHSVLYQPDGGRCLADATVRALQDRAAVHGAIVRFESPATCRPEVDGVVVRSGDYEYRAPVAVLAAGPWAADVVPVPLPPLTVTREQIFHFRPVDPALPWPSFYAHGKPPRYGLCTPGEGVKVAEHLTGSVTDADRRNFEIDAEGRDRIREYVERCMPGLDPTPVSASTCLYTLTPTQDFVIDRSGPLVVAAGFSGHGFKFTPLIGRLLADLAEGTPTGSHPRFRMTR